MWEPGERDAVIEATAGLNAGQHHEAFGRTATQLEAVWATIKDWDGYQSTVFTRWRELWIHLVDLNVGIEPAAWDRAFTTHVIDLFSQRLPPGHGVHATDLAQTWGTGTITTDTGPHLAAWLTGRKSRVKGPELGPWPAY